MDYTVLIAGQRAAQLVSGALDDVQFIADTQVLAPQARAALERIALRLRRLGALADAAEIEEAQQCR